jgi:predicted metal-dependent hydrolase
MFERGVIHLDERRIEFTVARSKRRRRTIAFQMETPLVLKIMAPMRASLKSIHAVIEKQRGWIRRRLAQLQQPLRLLTTPQTFQDGERFTYLGHDYKLCVTHHAVEPQGCKLLPHRLQVNAHAGNLNTKDKQAEVRLEILLWLKKRAKEKFQKRMDVWAKRLGVSYTKLVVANAERRWGSCNSKNVIRLNWRLILAPLPVLDYVVVHELCHVRNKNHGKLFWAQVASVMPDWKTRRKHLHTIGGGLVL